ncbi:type IV pilus secretin PilQ [Aquirhabdus sp.]|uniref:type IV pilus secretin PilQ n=1 Tax=Aquirhabdus sp. TaxID=2824160 RepID=UPI00396C4E0C
MEVSGVKESARDLKKVFDLRMGHELAMRSVARRFVTKALPMHLAIVSACAITMTAYASSTVTLTGINTTALPNNETELRLAFDGTPPNPQAYQLDKPARLVVDLPNAKSSLASRYQDIGSGNARSLAVVDNAERTRLVVNLSQASGYSTRVEGNTLILKVGGTKASAAKTVATTAPVNAVTPVAGNKSIAYEVTDVDFRRGGSGEGNVLIALNNPNAPVDVQQQGTKIIARFLGTKLPERLRRRLDVNDFGTPIKTIDAYNEGNNGILVIQPQGDFEYLAYQADNKLTISVKPVVQQKTAEAKPPTYTGQKLSLNFQDIEVRSVLQLIADFTGLNLVASDTVAGKITIRLQNVPWDQALDIVLKTKGLDKRRNGNVIMIAPADELAAREKIEIQNNRQVEQLAPLTTQYIQLSYAKASDLFTLITSGRNNGGGGGGGTVAGGTGGDANVGSLLSSRGTVSVDTRTNTLIVQDTATTIDKVREMIARLDVPIKQVMIEARIVRASDTFSKELGVQWGILSHGTASRPNLLVGGSETTLFDLRNPQSTTLNGQTGVGYTITRPDNLSVDLAATGSGASSIALGVMSISDIMLDLTLSALQADGKGEVIATPKVLTLDKQKARVAAGTTIPYQQSTSSGATSIAFVNAELSLEVVPSITPDGRVGMELMVNADSVGDAAPNGQLTINTNRLQTNVLVDDGQTVVLGGIFQNQISSSTTKVPFLGDLPYLGRLFRHTLQANNKQEMLIFVTPRLVNSTTQVNQSAKP